MKIAIDLGTTNCLVAVRHDGNTELVPNQFGNTTTPSIVCINKNNIFVGEMAYEKELEFPDKTFRFFKRSMGEPEKIRNSKYTSIDLSAILLKQLITDAEKYMGESVDEVIVSVPAYFTDAQRQATRQSALRCGVECKRIINEPSAASLAYYQETKNEGLILVFDFGGGTLDVTIVDIFDNIVDIVAIAGDNYLGGHDLDTILFSALVEKFPSVRHVSLEEKQILMSKIEKLKINLSTNTQASFTFNLRGNEEDFLITQQEFIELSSQLLHRIKAVVGNALTDAGINASDIEDVVFVGGSSKSIVIQEFIRELMGRTVNIDINPDEAIIQGLGTMLAIIDRESNLKDIVLTDVCPFTLGIDTVGDVYSPIIPRNTTLPTSKKRYYFTIYDFQNAFDISIYQGESLVASHNNRLLKVNVKLKKKLKGEAGAYVTFAYDINGILKITIDGDDVLKPYTNEIATNTMVSSTEFKQTQKLLSNLSNLSIDRTDLLSARFDRLARETSGIKHAKLEALFGEFARDKEHASKGELIILTRTYNDYLDNLESELLDPFDVPSLKHFN